MHGLVSDQRFALATAWSVLAFTEEHVAANGKCPCFELLGQIRGIRVDMDPDTSYALP
jgi:hypothetical protein